MDAQNNLISSYTKKTGVFFIGNYYVADDGFAIHVYRLLKDGELPQNVDLIEFGVKGLDLLETFQHYDKVILIDTLAGFGEPGKIFRLNLLEDSLSKLGQQRLSAHHIGVAELLELGKNLYPNKFPKEIFLIGVEASDITSYGTTLSDPVQKAIPVVLGLLSKEIG